MKLRAAMLAVAALCALSTVSEAKPRKVSAATINCTDRGCSDWSAAPRQQPARSVERRVAREVRRAHRHVQRVARKAGLGLSGIVAPLAAKVAEIQGACGSTVISAVRHTRVRGSGRISLHASGRAVDMQGNPKCIYAQLQGWPGGYSVDYGRVRHVHISFSPNGREWGSRFAHWRPHRRVRLAHAR